MNSWRKAIGYQAIAEKNSIYLKGIMIYHDILCCLMMQKQHRTRAEVTGQQQGLSVKNDRE